MSIDSALNDLAKSLSVNKADLIKLIAFESAFNPLARNPITGARGLIQFLHSTARNLGYTSADDLVARYPDVESQLRGPVLKYLSKFKPFSSPYPQSLYLSVFYPQKRFSSPDTVFSDNIRVQNPGINTIKDYVNYVEKIGNKYGISEIKKYSPIGFFLPIIAAALAVFYLPIKRRWIDDNTNFKRRGGKALSG